jgi:SAM-dependent methyltransferase
MVDSDVEDHTPSGRFSREQRNEAYPHGVGAHAWFQGRNRILYSKLPEEAKAGVVLDVGCGPGITVAHLRRKSVDCHGCDLSRHEPEDSSQSGYLHYGRDSTSMPVEFRKSVGTLLMLDLLEHVHEPKEFLRSSLEAFPGLKYMLITLPARKELWSEYDERFGHVDRFDLPGVRDLCAEAGLEMVSSGYFFHSLYAVLLAKGRRKGERPMRIPRSARLHSAIGRLLYLEEQMLPRSLPGSSVYALLRVV